MFERDLPGENTSGLSFQKASEKLPLETCETVSNSWGYNLGDTTYKTKDQLIKMLVKAAGLGANLLLNIGPMPNGQIQPEFKKRLADVGDWLTVYGESIYATKAGFIKPQNWGCVTQKANKIYLHVLNANYPQINIPNFPNYKIVKAYLLKNGVPVTYQSNNHQLVIKNAFDNMEPDNIVVLEFKN